MARRFRALSTETTEDLIVSRMDNLLSRLALADNEGILIHKPSNMFYLSGYTGEGLIVAGKGFRAIVTDFRYTEQAENQAPDFAVRMIETGVSHAQSAGAMFSENGVDTVYFEDDYVTVKMYQAIQKAMPGVNFKPIAGAPEKLREIKDDDEIAHIEEACVLSCKAFENILPRIREGMTEKELQLALDYEMLSLGADGIAFSTIVASGENGSLPHAIPGERKIRRGDMITLDFGAKKGGYCADMTRTVALGEPSAEMRAIYDIVYRAQCECQAALAPGKSCAEIDRLSRDIIYGAGYEGRFGHGLGHAVGIDIHESPRLSPACNDVLLPGHTMTVEPGIYIPGLGGVRIENTCVITKDGARTLVHAQKELLIL